MSLTPTVKHSFHGQVAQEVTLYQLHNPQEVWTRKGTVKGKSKRKRTRETHREWNLVHPVFWYDDDLNVRIEKLLFFLSWLVASVCYLTAITFCPFSHSGQLTHRDLLSVCFGWSPATQWLILNIYLWSGDNAESWTIWEELSIL